MVTFRYYWYLFYLIYQYVLFMVNALNLVETEVVSYEWCFFGYCFWMLQDVALLTDGRFSGGSHGFVVGHICPEAQVH